MKGGTLCISYLYIPSLLLAPPQTMIKQWQKSFDVGKIVHPGLSLLSSFAYGYIAYQWQGTLHQRAAEMYGVCIAANLAIWPWTIFVMMPTNKKLFKRFDEVTGSKAGQDYTEPERPQGESTKELVQSWSRMNVIRGFMPLVGCVLGVWMSV